MEQEKRRKAGELYKKTAEQLLHHYRPRMSSRQHNRLLEHGDYHQLEDIVDAEGYLGVVTIAVQNKLNEIGISIPSNFQDIVLFSETASQDLGEIRSLCRLAYITNRERGELVLEIAEAIHDMWVALYRDCFFVNRDFSQLYLYMPLEFVGSERVEYYYNVFIAPLFSALDLEVADIYIERAYARFQDSIFKSKGVRDEQTLCNLLVSMNYPPHDPDIELILGKNPILVHEIATQIVEKNPVLRGE